jgi:hypothetical protein
MMEQAVRRDGIATSHAEYTMPPNPTQHSSSRSDSLPLEGDANIDGRVVNLFRTTQLFLFAVTVALVTFVGCRSGSNAIMVESRAGTVADDMSAAAIANANVFQVYWGAGIAGEPRPVFALRWAKADENGAFVFRSEVAPEVRRFGAKVSDAEYGFFHGDYGLVRRGVPTSSGDVTLRGRKLDPAGLEAMQLNLCGSRPADEVLMGAARFHCKHGSR